MIELIAFDLDINICLVNGDYSECIIVSHKVVQNDAPHTDSSSYFINSDISI